VPPNTEKAIDKNINNFIFATDISLLFTAAVWYYSRLEYQKSTNWQQFNNLFWRNLDFREKVIKIFNKVLISILFGTNFGRSLPFCT